LEDKLNKLQNQLDHETEARQENKKLMLSLIDKVNDIQTDEPPPPPPSEDLSQGPDELHSMFTALAEKVEDLSVRFSSEPERVSSENSVQPTQASVVKTSDQDSNSSVLTDASSDLISIDNEEKKLEEWVRIYEESQDFNLKAKLFKNSQIYYYLLKSPPTNS